MDIPVYLVAGFLDAGKTEFINGVLQDGFAGRREPSSSAVRRGSWSMTPEYWRT